MPQPSWIRQGQTSFMKNRMLRNHFALFAAVLASVPLAVAQAKPAPNATPTFSARTELVLVPTIVTDHRGAHIGGLSKDDFIVEGNGVEQKVATFEEGTATAKPVYRVSGVSRREYSNLRFTDYAPRRINIILLDTLNTPITDQMFAKQQLIKFLRSEEHTS